MLCVQVETYMVIVQQLIGLGVWLSRRLQPAAAMLLREFTGADIDADNETVRMYACILKMAAEVLECTYRSGLLADLGCGWW